MNWSLLLDIGKVLLMVIFLLFFVGWMWGNDQVMRRQRRKGKQDHTPNSSDR